MRNPVVGSGGHGWPSGIRKAAVWLIALGSAAAADVLGHLEEAESEAPSTEMAVLQHVECMIETQVLTQQAVAGQAHEVVMTGSVDYARDVLERDAGYEWWRVYAAHD